LIWLTLWKTPFGRGCGPVVSPAATVAAAVNDDDGDDSDNDNNILRSTESYT